MKLRSRFLVISMVTLITGCKLTAQDLTFETLLKSSITGLNSILNSLLSPKKTELEQKIEDLTNHYEQEDLKSQYQQLFPKQRNINKRALLGTWKCSDKTANNKVSSSGIITFYSNGTFKENNKINVPVSFVTGDKKDLNVLSYSLKNGYGKWHIDQETKELYITVNQQDYFSKLKHAHNARMKRKILREAKYKQLSNTVLNNFYNISSQSVPKTVTSLRKNSMSLEDYTMFDRRVYVSSAIKIIKLAKHNPKILEETLADLNKNGANYSSADIYLMANYVPASTYCKKISSK